MVSSGSSRNNHPKPAVSLKSQRGRPRTVSSPRHPENADFIASASSNFFSIDDHYHPSSSFGKPLQTDGFTTYLAGDQCPDQLCKLASKLHFHCNQLRCYYSTDQQNVLEMHSQDFHQTFEIPDGFAAYDKMYDCRGSPGCPFNSRYRHFHCLRISCNFEPLLKFHDLLSHTNLKHSSSSSPSCSSSSSISSPSQETSIKKIIKTAGTVYPKISSEKMVSF
uniref:C2H2-type domain-containing protein n=1 Tax=Romanomermis culicivorax TaxID=13658 RepID=A0A915IDW2_ROMCU